MFKLKQENTIIIRATNNSTQVNNQKTVSFILLFDIIFMFLGVLFARNVMSSMFGPF